MKLPNADRAVVEEAKVRRYLLDATHSHGASKAYFFVEFGFTQESWGRLAVALKQHAVENDVAKAKETGFGPRYEIDGQLRTPDGRFPQVRTVWQLDYGQMAPRLITAHPLEAET